MPIGDFVNLIPAPVFLLIHLTLFAAGAYSPGAASRPMRRRWAGGSASSRQPRSAT